MKRLLHFLNNIRQGIGFFFPPVVFTLVFINITLVLMENKLPIGNINFSPDRFSFFYVGSPLFRPYQFFTYMFLHTDLSHVLYNMVVLVIFGTPLEKAIGSVRFLVIYIFAGLISCCVHWAYNWSCIEQMEAAYRRFLSNPSLDSFVSFVNTHDPTNYKYNRTVIHDYSTKTSLDSESLVGAIEKINQLITAKKNGRLNGASGAAFGVVMAFIVFLSNKLVWTVKSYYFPIRGKVIAFLALLMFAMPDNPSTSGTAYFAHLGGALGGVIIATMMYNKKVKIRDPI